MKSWYKSGREAVISGTVRIGFDPVYLLPVDSTYTFDVNHQFLSQVAAGARASTPLLLSAKTFTNGLFDATDPTIAMLATGKVITGIICFRQGAAEADSHLLTMTTEEPGGAALSIPGNGGPVTIQLPDGILSLGDCV